MGPEQRGRHLGLLRHAKTEQLTPGDDRADHERELLPRGWADARAGARWLAAPGRLGEHPVGLVLCSTATRTRQTWEALSEAGAVRADDVWFDRRIYRASVGTLLDVLADVPDDVSSVLLVGHAPAVPALARALADRDGSDAGALEAIAGGLRPAGYAALTLQVPWSGIAPGTASLEDCHTFRR